MRAEQQTQQRVAPMYARRNGDLPPPPHEPGHLERGMIAFWFGITVVLGVWIAGLVKVGEMVIGWLRG